MSSMPRIAKALTTGVGYQTPVLVLAAVLAFGGLGAQKKGDADNSRRLFTASAALAAVAAAYFGFLLIRLSMPPGGGALTRTDAVMAAGMAAMAVAGTIGAITATQASSKHYARASAVTPTFIAVTAAIGAFLTNSLFMSEVQLNSGSF